MVHVYHKVLIVSPGLIFVQKAFLVGLFLGRLIFGGRFALQNGFGLTKEKTASSSYSVSLTVSRPLLGRPFYRKDICV